MAKTTKDLESKLLESLSKKNLTPKQLKNLTTQVALFKKEGLLIDDILVKGKPKPLKIFVRGIVNPEYKIKFKSINGILTNLDIFPYGTIRPDVLQFNAIIDQTLLNF